MNNGSFCLNWPKPYYAKILRMTETLAHGYSSESTRRELSNEYQHAWQGYDDVQMNNGSCLIWSKQYYAKILKMTKTLAHGYSSESTRRELSNEYQHEMVFKKLCILVLWTKVASALEGLRVIQGCWGRHACSCRCQHERVAGESYGTLPRHAPRVQLIMLPRSLAQETGVGTYTNTSFLSQIYSWESMYPWGVLVRPRPPPPLRFL